jgi:hypothetical protein
LLTDVIKHDTILNRIRLNGAVRQILRDPRKLEKPIVVQCSKFLGVALPLFPRQTTAAGSGGRLSSWPLIKADQNASNQKRAAKHGTDEIEVMTGTVRQAPTHAGKQAEPFGDVSEDHDR